MYNTIVRYVLTPIAILSLLILGYKLNKQFSFVNPQVINNAFTTLSLIIAFWVYDLNRRIHRSLKKSMETLVKLGEDYKKIDEIMSKSLLDTTYSVSVCKDMQNELDKLQNTLGKRS